MYYKIHFTHTKNDLISYIIELNINIKYNYLPKSEIMNLFDTYMRESDINYEFIPNQYHIKTVRDLIKYLESARPSQDEKITAIEHKKYIQIAKKILCYVNNGCYIERTPYKEQGEQQLLTEAKILGMCACHIPSCRRAIRMLNEQRGPDEKIDVVLKPELMNSLNSNTLLKLNSKPIYTVKYGKFFIDFS